MHFSQFCPCFDPCFYDHEVKCFQKHLWRRKYLFLEFSPFSMSCTLSKTNFIVCHVRVLRKKEFWNKERTERNWCARRQTKNVVVSTLMLTPVCCWSLFLNWTVYPLSRTSQPIVGTCLLCSCFVSVVHVFWKHCRKRRNRSWQAISTFRTVFSILWRTFMKSKKSLLQTHLVLKGLKFVFGRGFFFDILW